ncbi:hypothetical protein ACQ7HM_08610 [Williamsia sp. MIQD14]|uniref:hypothetical protein n=1 Tax=Williamsia sp. MIQD14 TaxID=3425703 RepID=UPI003DA04AC5
MRPADQIEEILRSMTGRLDRERTRHSRASAAAAQAWREPLPDEDDPNGDDDDRASDADDDGADDRRRRPILDPAPR